MKIALMVLPLFFSLNLFAKTSEIDGVPMNCLDKANPKIGKSERLSLVAVCRSRSNPTLEYYTYCDGSQCKGFTATFKNKQCKLSDFWTGQDDQDSIDPVEWQKECLIGADFKTKNENPPKADLNSLKSDNNTGIKDASVFQLEGDVEKLSSLEKAEIIGKQLRREYYKRSYQVGAYSYKEVHFEAAKEALMTSEGEFKALTRKEINKLETWFEDHSVESVVQMQLEVSYMSGTGLEDNYIFIPAESYEPILVINRFYYSE